MQTNRILGVHTQITRHCDNFGKSIEEELRQAQASKTPISSTTDVTYTPLKDGVLPQYDIRTDRQEIALDATEKMAKSDILHNDELPKVEEKVEQQTDENNAGEQQQQ
jgi:hypothetical protein